MEPPICCPSSSARKELSSAKLMNLCIGGYIKYVYTLLVTVSAVNSYESALIEEAEPNQQKIIFVEVEKRQCKEIQLFLQPSEFNVIFHI